MIQILSRLLVALCIGLLFLLARPLTAHEHNDQAPVVEQTEAEPGRAIAQDHSHMTMHVDEDEEHRPATMTGRLLAWIGHMHPFAVHFPIALFPISWITLIFARRRGDKADLIRAIVIVAGLAAVVAATLGWLNAGFVLADPNPIRLAHRWTGTTLGLTGALLALWAWRRPAAIEGRLMVWALGILTIGLLVQGWLGAILTHGMSHLRF
jgi:uncharacterized membrane protein